MSVVGLLWLVVSAWAVPDRESILNVYGFPPKYPQLGDFGDQDVSRGRISLRDVFENPLIILTDSGTEAPRRISAYYAKNGLGSIPSYAAFKPLHNYLRQYNNLLGLVFPNDGFPYMPAFFRYNVQDVIFSDDFTVEDLVEFTDEDLLVLYVASENDFKQCGFPQGEKVGTFSFNDQSVVPFSHGPQSNYPSRLLPYFVIRPYYSRPHDFMRPVYPTLFPQRPPSVTTVKPPQKVDSIFGISEAVKPPKDSSSNNDVSLPNKTSTISTIPIPVTSASNPVSPISDSSPSSTALTDSDNATAENIDSPSSDSPNDKEKMNA